ncbi:MULTISPECIES: hypothetical protein [unclassified Caulobacter]|uniref:hypothetical protein n=1 Tax=unclassified Caulobacter TaxID=2648921 RepID=UPI0012E3F9BC|nr:MULTISPECIES: hypothetical protein [unclassified Caulobacter]
MKTSEFRERLLVALFLAARDTDLGAYYSPSKVADDVGLERRPGQLRLVVRDLDERGYVKPSYTMGGGDEGGLDLRLTNVGVEEAEELLELHPDYASRPRQAPGADRYISFSDNVRIGLSVDASLLGSAVRGCNSVSDEDREIALSEIAIFESTIIQNRVPEIIIDRFVNKILGWIRDKFGEALVGAIAGAIITKLLPILAS